MTRNTLFGDIVDNDKWLYHYTSKETALEHILSSGKIRLNLFRNLNDPRESKDWNFSVKSPKDTELTNKIFFDIQRDATNYVKNRCKVLCMVKDDARINPNSIDYMFHRGFSKPRMWAQYGKDHTGVCLIIDREKLIRDIQLELGSRGETYIGHVKYANFHEEQVHAFDLDYGEVLNSSLPVVLDSKIQKHHKHYFFTKAEDWANKMNGDVFYGAKARMWSIYL